jgi:hypothetical protein
MGGWYTIILGQFCIRIVWLSKGQIVHSDFLRVREYLDLLSDSQLPKN